jgi:ribosomal protein L9
MGLKSDKNFITANAVDIILMGTKKKPMTCNNYLTKHNYGKTPVYLSKIQEDIEKEYKAIREIQIRNDEDEARKKKKLSCDEIENLREGLQKRLAQVKKDYGNITHKTVIDTIVCRRYKTDLEKEINIIESDLEKLNKGQVIIDMTR